MRSPPSVLMPVGRSPWAFAAALLPVLAGGLVLVAWAWGAQDRLRPGLVALGWAGAAALALRHARLQPTGVLRWDGAAWAWWADGSADGERTVHPRVALDLQAVMLLKLELDPATGGGASVLRPSGAMWLWLTPGGDSGRWLALRRCLYWSARRP